MPLWFLSEKAENALPKGGPADQFKPVVQWPHVEGVEVDLNSIRIKQGKTHTPVNLPSSYILEEKTPGLAV